MRFFTLLAFVALGSACLCTATIPCVGDVQCTAGLVCLAVTPGASNTCEEKTCEHPCLGDADCEYFTQQNRATTCQSVPAQCGVRKICQLP